MLICGFRLPISNKWGGKKWNFGQYPLSMVSDNLVRFVSDDLLLTVSCNATRNFFKQYDLSYLYLSGWVLFKPALTFNRARVALPPHLTLNYLFWRSRSKNWWNYCIRIKKICIHWQKSSVKTAFFRCQVKKIKERWLNKYHVHLPFGSMHCCSNWIFYQLKIWLMRVICLYK